jgi:hypothetical protein
MNFSAKLYSILHNKCPRCHKGSFFISDKAFNLKTFSKMHEKCPVCQEPFEPEPGYYFGAMYVSYAINVAIMVAVWVACSLLFPQQIGIWGLVGISIIVGLLFTPLTFRYARLIWINMFVRFNPEITSR